MVHNMTCGFWQASSLTARPLITGITLVGTDQTQCSFSMVVFAIIFLPLVFNALNGPVDVAIS